MCILTNHLRKALGIVKLMGQRSDLPEALTTQLGRNLCNANGGSDKYHQTDQMSP